MDSLTNVFKKGGKARKNKPRQTQKQKQQQTININNVIGQQPRTRTRRARTAPSSGGPSQAPQPPAMPSYSNYTKMFVGQPNDFKSVSVGQNISSSDNVNPIMSKVEDIINGRVKQMVHDAIDNRELSRINDQLRMPLLRSISSGSVAGESGYEPSSDANSVHGSVASNRASDIANVVKSEREEKAESVISQVVGREEKQVDVAEANPNVEESKQRDVVAVPRDAPASGIPTRAFLEGYTLPQLEQIYIQIPRHGQIKQDYISMIIDASRREAGIKSKLRKPRGPRQ